RSRAATMRIWAAAIAVLAGGCYSGDQTASEGESPTTGTTGTTGPGPGTTGGDTTGDTDGGTQKEVPAQPLHRLNRLEYNNTVRDLLGTTLRPADAFGPDPE